MRIEHPLKVGLVERALYGLKWGERPYHSLAKGLLWRVGWLIGFVCGFPSRSSASFPSGERKDPWT